MINQVGKNYAQIRAFSDFNQPQNGSYLIMPKSEDKKQSGISGKKITLYAMGAGFGLFALTKGIMPKSFSKVLNKWKMALEKKVSKGSKLKNFYRFALGKIDNFRGRFESINNFTTIKDVAVQRVMYGKNGQHKFTRKIHETITNLFNKISRKTVNTSYAKTNRRFASLNEYIFSLNEKLLRENPNNHNTINAINKRMIKVNSKLEEGFGIDARNKRLEEMNKASEGLFENFWKASLSDIKNFKSKNIWSSYIAEDYLIKDKMKMANETGILRKAITHDINDSYFATIKAIDNIQKFVKPNDIETNKALNKVRNNLAQYRKLSGTNETQQRSKLNKEIVENLTELSEKFKEFQYNDNAKKAIQTYIEDVNKIISNNSKGELQEILTLYKQILPRNEYLKFKKQVQKAVRSLDKSIDTEINKYFDKARDLKLGAAPTDVISILVTTGTVGWFLGKSKDRDERISASLNYGIPAVGAIATSLYCTARLISGGKSMAFGLVSGWLIGKLGTAVDNMRKKYSLDVAFKKRNVEKLQSDKV